MVTKEQLDFLNGLGCPITVTVQLCDSKPALDGSDFNNAAEPTFYRWKGTIDEFTDYINTPFGAMEIYEMRRQSKVIMVFSDDTAAEIYP